MNDNVTKLLGAAPSAQIAAIRTGFLAVDLLAAKDTLGISLRELLAILGVAERTGSRLIAENGRLDAAASERLLRLLSTARELERVLGTHEKALQWLKCFHRELGCEPITLLDTGIGLDEVHRILQAIEHGLPV